MVVNITQLIYTIQDYDWQLVSNNLNSRIRRYSIRQLIPDEYYELKITANNDAGSSQETYTFQVSYALFFKTSLDAVRMHLVRAHG